MPLETSCNPILADVSAPSALAVATNPLLVPAMQASLRVHGVEGELQARPHLKHGGYGFLSYGNLWKTGLTHCECQCIVYHAVRSHASGATGR
jgi:hypothetical protein